MEFSLVFPSTNILAHETSGRPSNPTLPFLAMEKQGSRKKLCFLKELLKELFKNMCCCRRCLLKRLVDSWFPNYFWFGSSLIYFLFSLNGKPPGVGCGSNQQGLEMIPPNFSFLHDVVGSHTVRTLQGLTDPFHAGNSVLLLLPFKKSTTLLPPSCFPLLYVFHPNSYRWLLVKPRVRC